LLASKNVALDNEIKEAKEELIELKASKEEELKEAKVRYETITKEKNQNIDDKRKAQQDQLEGIIVEIDKKDVKITKSMDSAFLGHCDQQCEGWKKDVKELNSMKLSIQKKLSGLSQDDSSSYSDFVDIVQNKYNQKIVNAKFKIKTLRKKLHEQSINNIGVERIRAKIMARGIRYEDDKAQADARSKNTEGQLNKDKSQIINWKKNIEELEGKRKELNKEISKHESYSQIYRFTKYWMNFSADKVCEEYYENEKVISDKSTEASSNWFGLLRDDTEVNTSQKTEKVCKKYIIKEITAADVTLEDVTKTAFWWYGSLAALVSIMGVVLAFGALILKHPKEKYKDLNPEKRHRLKNSIRRMFVSLRKRIREPKIVTRTVIKEVPKEVIKEIPVDKVVLKEVPIEIVKKEIFYEPLYTKDPDLLKFGTAKVRDILSKFGKGKSKDTDKGKKGS
jgi:formiminotetrahydrofolate cyclodeaminase